jgi:hypothetical protein
MRASCRAAVAASAPRWAAPHTATNVGSAPPAGSAATPAGDLCRAATSSGGQGAQRRPRAEAPSTSRVVAARPRLPSSRSAHPPPASLPAPPRSSARKSASFPAPPVELLSQLEGRRLLGHVVATAALAPPPFFAGSASRSRSCSLSISARIATLSVSNAHPCALSDAEHAHVHQSARHHARPVGAVHAHHGVGLAAPGLAVREHARAVPVDGRLHERLVIVSGEEG